MISGPYDITNNLSLGPNCPVVAVASGQFITRAKLTRDRFGFCTLFLDLWTFGPNWPVVFMATRQDTSDILTSVPRRPIVIPYFKSQWPLYLTILRLRESPLDGVLELVWVQIVLAVVRLADGAQCRLALAPPVQVQRLVVLRFFWASYWTIGNWKENYN